MTFWFAAVEISRGRGIGVLRRLDRLARARLCGRISRRASFAAVSCLQSLASTSELRRVSVLLRANGAKHISPGQRPWYGVSTFCAMGVDSLWRVRVLRHSERSRGINAKRLRARCARLGNPI